MTAIKGLVITSGYNRYPDEKGTERGEVTRMKVILIIISAIVYAGIQFFKMLLDVANNMGKN